MPTLGLCYPGAANPKSRARKLERELRRQLNSSRPSAPEEWIADPYIPGRHNLIRSIPHFTISIHVEPTGAARGRCQVWRRIGNKRRQLWVRKVRVIQNVE